MGYIGLPKKTSITDGQSEQFWQLRVHIAAKALDKNNVENEIDLITQCLVEVFNEDQVDIKIYQIKDQEDLDVYDGALSPIGKDRTQVGKEVCIYMPDSHIQQLSPDEYKSKLLTLWKLLQKNHVPLLHFNVPGDQNITISDSTIPSPFSFTSNNPNRQEWNDKHGILFKEFEAHGVHPILQVNFSIEDLKEKEIALEELLIQSPAFLKDHSMQIRNKINEQLAAISHQDDYQTFLETEALLKSLLAVYKEANDKCNTIEKRAAVQENFVKDLEYHLVYQRLVSAYPHEADSHFSENPLIREIMVRIRGELSDERIKEIADGLNSQYEEKVADILKDFQEAEINYDGYNIEQLIRKNPAAMQSVFRQQALADQEKTQNELVNSGSEALKIALLNSYKTERNQKTQSQYFFLGNLFRLFGAWSKKEKFDAVDALIQVLKNKNEDVFLDKKHLGPLQQGTLGTLVGKLNLDLNAMLPPANIESQDRSSSDHSNV